MPGQQRQTLRRSLFRDAVVGGECFALKLGKLDAAALSSHVAAIVGKLEASNETVRGAAVQPRAKLEAAARAG